MNNEKPNSIKSGDQAEVGGDVSKSVVISGDGNVVNVGEKKIPSKSKPTHSRSTRNTVAWISFWGLVIAALITAVGTIIPSLLTAADGRPQKPSITFISEPTITNIPNLNEPTATVSPISPIPLGEDWIQGCISTLWIAYPSTVQSEQKGDGCWKEPIHTFSAEHGDLDFLFERRRGTEEVYGLFAPLPQSGSLNLTIRLKDLTNSDLLIGIYTQPDVYSQGLLMIMLNGGVEKNVFIQKDPLTYKTLQGTKQIEQGNGYSITFHFDDLSVRSTINPSVFFLDSTSLPASQKYLFLGYKGLSGYYRIEGTFLNFELAP